MTFVLLPGPQTQLAIDTASAMKVYASNGLTELGQKMAIARAGAATVNVTNVMKPDEAKK
jgi:urease accessory protein UreH